VSWCIRLAIFGLPGEPAPLAAENVHDSEVPSDLAQEEIDVEL
jgi:hypothetical protein